MTNDSKLKFEILDDDIDGRNSLLNYATTIAVLHGPNGDVEFGVYGDVKLYWKGELYKECNAFPEDLVTYLSSCNDNTDSVSPKEIDNADLEIDLSNMFSFEWYDANGAYIDGEDEEFNCDTKTGKIDFVALKNQMVDCYNSIFECDVAKDKVEISPKGYFEKGGKTTSKPEDLVKADTAQEKA